ncbi:MAG: hypothetical protein D6698_15935 [Gammaproteobacteria bacterium]|nr:MAG: hypothetical protein D6698_15935 [Gammaproteobacteria bacterium]
MPHALHPAGLSQPNHSHTAPSLHHAEGQDTAMLQTPAIITLRAAAPAGRIHQTRRGTATLLPALEAQEPRTAPWAAPREAALQDTVNPETCALTDLCVLLQIQDGVLKQKTQTSFPD